MGRQSTKQNKTIYQLYREEAGLTGEKASELMDGGLIASEKLMTKAGMTLALAGRGLYPYV